MRKAVWALLASAYILIALTVAALFWRAGAGWAVGASVLIGTLALTFTVHGMVGRALQATAFRRDLEAIRQAHRLLADQLEGAEAAFAGLSGSLQEQAASATSELATEVRMLEGLVERMGANLETRLFTERAGGGAPHVERRDRKSAELLHTVREALADGRVDLYLQPVVSLPQRRTVFYESFSRLRDETGRILMPAEYLAVAEPEGLVPAIDNLLLFRCVQIVRRLAKQDRKIGIFCNISLASLGDESFFPQFLDFLAQNRDLSGALIFELGQAAFEERGGIEARNMAKLADLGFRFSIDKVTDLELDYQDLARADVKFLKVSAEVLLSQVLEVEGRMAMKSMRDLQAADFSSLTRRYGVEVVAEKIEAERQVIDVLELDISYGQGHLFGEPRAIREAVLAETAPPADFMHGALTRRRAGGRV
ncbi:MAG TPA: EAL domain-containing protein [Caulobacteraceae bacterium]|jgi:cyclic-di-GMP phosphodiesterase TipF (flagellum assembly factor)|nr:EAL domain-containing protein [Caulobacteraceae bacterium]